MVTKFTYPQFQTSRKRPTLLSLFQFNNPSHILLVARPRKIYPQPVHSSHRKMSIVQMMSALKPCEVRRDMSQKQEMSGDKICLGRINNRFLIQMPPWYVKLMGQTHYYPPTQPYLLKERGRERSPDLKVEIAELSLTLS